MRYYIYKYVIKLTQERMIILNFSSLVLMERDKENNHFVKELGSYQVGEGSEYITKLFYDGDKVNMFFDTNKDVEEWEYSALYDLMDLGAFAEEGFVIEEVDDEYNPTWVLKFDYNEEYEVMEEKINLACVVIKEELEKAFENIKGKENEYI